MQVFESDRADGLRSRLTGLPDLEAVRARLPDWIGSHDTAGVSANLHAMLLGLHRFDTINIAYGTPAGDIALAEVASRIQHFAASELDGAWLAAHAGGGKFLLVANESCSRERWQLVAEQLADAIARPVIASAGVLRLSPRIALLRGLVGEEFDSMLDRLAQALEKATRQQGKRLAWASGEATPPGRSAAQLEADLHSAIDHGEIEILFQPQFALPDERLSGAEALARWNHPELGRIGAGALFTIAERADHIAPLSNHIARRALELSRDWPGDLRLSLNVTPADLSYASYARNLLDLMREIGFPPRRLTLEVTEQALLNDINMAAQMMADLSAQGIRIALDDFGAGFCNFRYLKVLPLHYLKLDRTMIDGITSDKRDLAVFRGIIAMAHALDLDVIAEGIESDDQLRLITEEGCACFQGFLRAAPMSAEEFGKLSGGPGATT
ncbi:MAG: GGDEF domain-containing phosphodiesterase [Sphingomonadaceae bacterium]|nr:GGDEF domain-containing phosphodiesterase [Sphingomonadaceae bacterium]